VKSPLPVILLRTLCLKHVGHDSTSYDAVSRRSGRDQTPWASLLSSEQEGFLSGVAYLAILVGAQVAIVAYVYSPEATGPGANKT
jgi:hypothetical protein